MVVRESAPSEGATPRESGSPIAATWPLLLGIGILMLGEGLQGTEISLRATIAGFAASLTGLVKSCYYVGYMFGIALTPRLVRRVGHIRVFAAMASVAAAVAIAQGLYIQPIYWGASQGVFGSAVAGIFIVAESWLNDRANRRNRGGLLAFYMLIVYVGLGGSQFLLIASGPQGLMPFMLIALFISMSVVPIALAPMSAPEITVPRRVRYRDLYQSSPLGVVAVTISGMVSSVVYSMGPVYAKLSGLDMPEVSTFMGVSIFAAVLTQYPVGRLCDYMDRRTVIAGVCFVAAVAATLLASLAAIPYALLLVLAALFSASAFTLYSLALAHANDHIDAAQRVAASGALLRLNAIGAAVSPILAGAMIGRFGPRAYFVVLAGLTGFITLYDLWRKTRRAPVAPERRQAFVPSEPQVMTGRLTVETGNPPGTSGRQ